MIALLVEVLMFSNTIMVKLTVTHLVRFTTSSLTKVICTGLFALQ